jgi:hypothetical protein
MAASVPTGFETNPPVTLYNTVTGSHRLVLSGANVAPTSCSLCSLNPRTAVGVTADNKLLLMTVDGRQTGFSEGVTLIELANLMLSHGAQNAINLDGGGSTQMAMNYYGDGLAAQLVNSPSETERLVGSNLAVFALRSGDYNGDGVVNAADYASWRDLDGNPAGFNSWKANFGAAGSGAGAALSVPEPSTVILATLVFSASLALRSLKSTARRISRVSDGPISYRQAIVPPRANHTGNSPNSHFLLDNASYPADNQRLQSASSPRSVARLATKGRY